MGRQVKLECNNKAVVAIFVAVYKALARSALLQLRIPGLEYQMKYIKIQNLGRQGFTMVNGETFKPIG